MVQPASHDNDEELEETILVELDDDSQQQQRSDPAVMTVQAVALSLEPETEWALLDAAPHVPPQTCHVRRLLPIPVGKGLLQDQHCLLPFSSSRHWYPDGHVVSSQVNPEDVGLSFLHTYGSTGSSTHLSIHNLHCVPPGS